MVHFLLWDTIRQIVVDVLVSSVNDTADLGSEGLAVAGVHQLSHLVTAVVLQARHTTLAVVHQGLQIVGLY